MTHQTSQVIKRINGEQIKVKDFKSYGLPKIYLFYLDNLIDQKFNIKFSLYKKIIHSFNKKLIDYILEGNDVKLPFGLGNIRIKKYKFNYEKNELRVDYSESKKAGKIIYHTNFHSDEWYAKWFWSKKEVRSSMKNYYSFEPCRANKKKLSLIMKIKDQWKKYLE